MLVNSLMFLRRFRWISCQLDVLRQCFPSSVRGILAELPESLDETYERILQQIPKQYREYTHQLLQCLVVAAYPFSVEELAEVLAIDFSATGMVRIMYGSLRPEDKERAVLSACSSLIAIVQDGGSRLVQFPHFSIKDFLTSDRLATSIVDTLRYHHVRHESAHLMMAQLCLSVLLQLDNDMDKQTIRSYPLSNYAGKHFVSHVEFENVISSLSDGVDNLLDRDKPHFYTWVWLQIGDWDPEDWHNSRIDRDSEDWHNSKMDTAQQYHDTKPKFPPQLPPLYYVAALGHLCLARHLILRCSQDLYVKDDKGCTPLHIAVLAGEEGVSQLLIGHSVDLDIQDINYRTPLHMVAYMGLTRAARMLLERGKPLKARLNARDKNNRTPLHLASQRGHSDTAGLLLKCGADVNARDNDTITPLHLVSQHHWGDGFQATKTACVLLGHGASVHVRNNDGQTPLHAAAHHGLSEIVALLLKFGADVDALDNNSMTPLLLISQSRFGDDSQITKTAQMLLGHCASVHVRNNNGQTPLHAAAHHGRSEIVALLLKFGADVDAQDNNAMTPLLLVSQSIFGDDPQITKTAHLLLEHGASVHVRDNNGQTPLHAAAYHGLSEIVALLLKSGADVDAQNKDAMTPLLLVSPPIFGDDSQITKTAQIAQMLLDSGASIHVRDKNGQTPLHAVSQRGLAGVAALILNFGADVDVLDKDAMTPLLLVSQSIFVNDSQITKTAQLLLEHGARVHVRNKNGQTPLHLASQRGLSGIVEFLLKFGADVDALDNSNMTPLHSTTSSPFVRDNNGWHLDDSTILRSVIKTAKLLLDHGANLQAENDKGETPFQVALKRGEREIVDILSDYVQK